VKITKFQTWLLKRIFRKLVKQGPMHQKNVIAVYSLMQSALKNEFTEDNDATLNLFSRGCHEASLLPKINLVIR
jgi:hypothetical protein